MQIVPDPEGTRLARIIYNQEGYPTGSLEISELTPVQVLRTAVPGYYRHGNEIYIRVRVTYECPPP
jgi:hypothetical protein